MNLLLAGGLVFVAISKREDAKPPAPEKTIGPVAVATSPAPQQAEAQPQPFRWQQLDSGSDYRDFIAKLRAIGCPENTIEDIVKGNVSRAFAWERSRQKNDGLGNGPWSEASELAVVNDLLGKPPAMSAGISPQGTAGGFAVNQSAAQAQVESGSLPSQCAQNGQDGNNWTAENAGQQQNLQFYPWLFQRGSSSASGSVSGGQPAIQSQQPNVSSGQTQNPSAVEPQNNVPANANPDDPSGEKSPAGPDFSARDSGPPGPPDPLGPNDPFAKSAQDINELDTLNYQNWFNQQVESQSGNGSFGLDLGGAPL